MPILNFEHEQIFLKGIQLFLSGEYKNSVAISMGIAKSSTVFATTPKFLSR